MPGLSISRKNFRQCRVDSKEYIKTEDGGQKTEDRRQRTEDRGQETEDRRRRTEDRGQKIENSGEKIYIKIYYSDFWILYS